MFALKTVLGRRFESRHKLLKPFRITERFLFSTVAFSGNISYNIIKATPHKDCAEDAKSDCIEIL